MINDSLNGKIKTGVAYFHFHENLNLKIDKNNILSCRKMNIIFENAKKIFLKRIYLLNVLIEPSNPSY